MRTLVLDPAHLWQWLIDAPMGRVALETLIRHWFLIVRDDEPKVYIEALQKTLGPRAEHEMMTIAEWLQSTARAEGEARGRSEGEARGKAEAETRIRAATIEKMRAMGMAEEQIAEVVGPAPTDSPVGQAASAGWLTRRPRCHRSGSGPARAQHPDGSVRLRDDPSQEC